MRKYLLTVWSCSLLFVCAFAQSNKNPLSEYMKGKVRLVEEKSTLYYDGFPPSQFINEDGEIENIPNVWDEYEDMDRFSKSSKQSTYDSLGRMLESVYFDEDGNISRKEVYEYEGEQPEGTKLEYTNERLTSKTVCEEQRAGFLSFVTYDQEDEPSYTTVVEWDEKEGKMSVTDEYGAELVLILFQLENNAITDVEYKALNEPLIMIRYTNNEQGDRIQESQTIDDGDGPEEGYTYFCTYEYDSFGNWTKQTKTIEGMDSPCDVTERKISYY